MESKQVRLKTLGSRIQTSYNKLLTPEDQLNLDAKPQMPRFQISYYLKQVLTRKQLVTVQFNDFDHGGQTAITGYFNQRGHITFFTSLDQKLIHLVTANAIRYIELT
ncbi:hypothetical protein [Loigolactobacillus iwatensis]|uniref:hypothetical protein n=1 Tax=Loigolactobacillus iwatensis TaxID=1267156 RepID=UPI000F7DA566|nr:hypothetical protein [Loigolactobacillus iwatensis]